VLGESIFARLLQRLERAVDASVEERVRGLVEGHRQLAASASEHLAALQRERDAAFARIATLEERLATLERDAQTPEDEDFARAATAHLAGLQEGHERTAAQIAAMEHAQLNVSAHLAGLQQGHETVAARLVDLEHGQSSAAAHLAGLQEGHERVEGRMVAEKERLDRVDAARDAFARLAEAHLAGLQEERARLAPLAERLRVGAEATQERIDRVDAARNSLARSVESHLASLQEGYGALSDHVAQLGGHLARDLTQLRGRGDATSVRVDDLDRARHELAQRVQAHLAQLQEAYARISTELLPLATRLDRVDAERRDLALAAARHLSSLQLDQARLRVDVERIDLDQATFTATVRQHLDGLQEGHRRGEARTDGLEQTLELVQKRLLSVWTLTGALESALSDLERGQTALCAAIATHQVSEE
jgi:chromosome segregation ATPase